MSVLSSPSTAYSHTQKAPLCWVFYGVGLLFAMCSLVLLDEPAAAIGILAAAMAYGIIGSAFQQLTVEDAGDRLRIRFGPIPLFARSVRYEDIQQVEVGRTTIFEGWGIHLSLRGGWVWNLWGRDCVVIHARRSVLRLGTDEAVILADFLRRRSGVARDAPGAARDAR